MVVSDQHAWLTVWASSSKAIAVVSDLWIMQATLMSYCAARSIGIWLIVPLFLDIIDYHSNPSINPRFKHPRQYTNAESGLSEAFATNFCQQWGLNLSTPFSLALARARVASTISVCILKRARIDPQCRGIHGCVPLVTFSLLQTQATFRDLLEGTLLKTNGSDVNLHNTSILERLRTLGSVRSHPPGTQTMSC